jgi:hypothetical protein
VGDLDRERLAVGRAQPLEPEDPRAGRDPQLRRGGRRGGDDRPAEQLRVRREAPPTHVVGEARQLGRPLVHPASATNVPRPCSRRR